MKTHKVYVHWWATFQEFAHETSRKNPKYQKTWGGAEPKIRRHKVEKNAKKQLTQCWAPLPVYILTPGGWRFEHCCSSSDLIFISSPSDEERQCSKPHSHGVNKWTESEAFALCELFLHFSLQTATKRHRVSRAPSLPPSGPFFRSGIMASDWKNAACCSFAKFCNSSRTFLLWNFWKI